eukprot:COSAG03_NODE_668_length_6372_cov_3.782879_7_plen_485_part_00
MPLSTDSWKMSLTVAIKLERNDEACDGGQAKATRRPTIKIEAADGSQPKAVTLRSKDKACPRDTRARTRAKAKLSQRRKKADSQAATPSESDKTATGGSAGVLKGAMMAAAAMATACSQVVSDHIGSELPAFTMPSDPTDLGSEMLDLGLAHQPTGPKLAEMSSSVFRGAGPAGMKAEINDRSANNLEDTADALMPERRRQMVPLILGDLNDAGVRATLAKYPGRRPCIGDKVRLIPGASIRRSLLQVLKPGELAEIIDDEKAFQHVPFHVKGPRGTLGFAGLADVEVVHASSKTGRPAGTDAAYWLSRVDQLHEEHRERTALIRRAERSSAARNKEEMEEEEARELVGRTVQLVDGRVATVSKLDPSGWLTLRTADKEVLEAFYDPNGRPLNEQLAAQPPITVSSPKKPSASSVALPGAALAAAVAAVKPKRKRDSDSESDADSDAISEPSEAGSPTKKLCDWSDMFVDRDAIGTLPAQAAVA